MSRCYIKIRNGKEWKCSEGTSRCFINHRDWAQLRDDDPDTWFVITNDLSLKKAKLAYNELIEVLRGGGGYDEWTNTWIQV